MALCLAGAVGGLGAVPQGDIAREVARAKAEGRRDVRMTITTDHSTARVDADSFLRTQTILIGTPVGLEQVASSESQIVTWREFRVTDTFALGGFAPAEWCRPIPRATLRVGAGRVLVGRHAGGSITVDGITITAGGPWDPFTPNRTYVLVGNSCEDGTFLLTHLAAGVFPVDASGRVQPAGSFDFPFVKRLLSLNSLENVRRYLRSL